MPSKNDSFFSRERHTIEVTSSQIVFAICGLIGFAVVCFGLGVYLGNVQEAAAPRMARQTTAAPPAPAPAPELKGAGVQTSPLPPRSGTTGPSAAPPVAEAEPVFLPVPEEPGHAPQPEAPPAPGPSTLGAETPPGVTAAEPSTPAEATVTAESPEATVTATADAVTAETPAPPAMVDATSTPPSPAAPAVTEAPASPAPVAPAPSPPSPATAPASTATTGQQTAAPFSAPGTFVVQVSASTDEKGAQQFAKKMEAAGQTKTRIVRSGDGKWYRVYVGEYANRQEAEAARATLAKMPGLADCFVKKLD